MLIEPRAPFVVGTPVEATLAFQNAAPATVRYDVKPMEVNDPGEDGRMEHMH